MKWKEYLGCGILLGLSALAKPSFLQTMIPAMCIWVILRIFIEKKIHWLKTTKLILMFVPAGLIILLQMFITFFSGNTASEGIGIEYGRVLHIYTSSIGISFLLTMAFPFFYFAMNMKKLKDKQIQLVMCTMLAGWAEMVFLYEKGIRETDANFTWGYMIAIFIVWVVTIREIIGDYCSNEKVYAENECTNPMRTVTSTVKCSAIWMPFSEWDNLVII